MCVSRRIRGGATRGGLNATSARVGLTCLSSSCARLSHARALRCLGAEQTTLNKVYLIKLLMRKINYFEVFGLVNASFLNKPDERTIIKYNYFCQT